MPPMIDISSWDLPSFLWNLPHTWSAPMEPERTPLFLIPSVAVSSTLTTPELEFYLPKGDFWVEMLFIYAGMTVFGIAMGCILYHYCVRPEAQFATTSYLVGYGVVLPFWLAFPSTFSYILGIRHKTLRFMATCSTSIWTFRTTAAVHGFSPEHTTRSMRDFAFYYAAPVLAKYDPKTQQYERNTHDIRIGAYARFLAKVFFAGMVASTYQMFPDFFPEVAKSPTTVWHDWRTILDWNNLKDNLLYAAFLQVYLTTFSEGMMALQANLTHINTEDTMNNPVFGSISPSEFWSKRWNLIVHDILKRGVFLPVRRHASTTVAVMATFFASGLFHEWLQVTVFATWDHTMEDGKCYLKGYENEVSSLHCYSPQWGASMAFFLWQAVLISMEFALGPYCKGFFLYIPAPVKTILTVLAGGCVAHWFTEPYVHSNFFLDGNAALFLVKRAGEATR